MRLKTLLAVAAAGLAFSAGLAKADTLDNLERERAQLIEAMLDPALAPADRQARIESEQRRLVDLERMVLRDESLKGRNTPTVRKAFANYDLTFLVHAALEKKVAIVDNWLDQVGVSTNSLMAARRGRR
ncbi:MAG: hypothetical protein ACYCZX_00035 [Rhodospirillaceae bacterium]